MLPLPLHASGCQVAICIGGIEGEDWQATCFGAVCMHEDLTASKPRIQTCAVRCNVQDPLDLCESAACSVGEGEIVLCGGRTGGEEQNSMWLGKALIQAKGHEQESLNGSKQGMSENKCMLKNYQLC